ncbi:hypothetical protein GRI72_05605 [Altererythrobacter marinus]|jgi:ElaB/YqjD/DUF883 family membrane-anchored ribosome-binding protein|uniref:YtxH domain-containing protein n=1 Tax=Pelagerythrobacter marinus TaxID=538382 RepID=A0ABW9UWH4_9SPHN|nr:hypothetical protein [Pelagerythrobacter marinus]MXO68301.1 hypothetical protein [Pelagerythrobacter marinus]
MADNEKSEELKNRIEAGQQRHANRSMGDYAREARDTATAFVKDHPIATVAGGLALGVIIASIVPGPGRRMRKKAVRRGSAMAAILAEMGAAYGASLLDNLGSAARTGGDRLEDIGDSIGDSARDFRREVGSQRDAARETVRRLTRDAGKRTGRTVRDLKQRIAH